MHYLSSSKPKYAAVLAFAIAIIVGLCIGMGQAAVTYENVASDGSSSTSGTSWVNKVQLQWTPSATDDWIIIASAEMQMSSNSKSARARLTIDSTTENEVFIRPTGATCWVPFTALKVVNLDNSQHTIDIDFTSSGSGVTCYIRNARIIAIKKDSLTVSSNAADSEGTLSSSETDIVSLNFTPSTQEDYLIVYSAEYKGDTSDAATFRAKLGGGTIDEMVKTTRRPYDDYLPFISFNVQNCPASQQTAKITAFKTSASTEYIRRARVVAIRLDGGFADAVWNSSDGQSTTASTTYQEKMTKSWSTGTDGNWALLASARIKEDTSTSRSVKARAQLNDSTTIGEHQRRPNNVNDFMNFSVADVRDVNDASRDVDIDYSTDNASATAYIKYAHFVGLPLDGAGGPTITTTTLDDGVQSVAYSDTVEATGGTAPYSWEVTVGSLPAGLSIASGTGVISGTPTTVENETFTVEVTDDNSLTDTKELSIDISADLVITTSSLPDGTDGTPYSQTVVATGGMTPLTWSVTVGSLPSGLSLASGTGVISGTPDAAGTENFTVQAADAATPQDTDTQALSITIDAVALNITTTTLPDGALSTAYSQTVVAVGGVDPYTWTIDSGSLPTGLSLASGTGVISGTPTVVQTANFTVKVTDDQGTPDTDTQALSITINYANLVITTSSLPNGTVDVAYSETVVATGGKTPYTWTIDSGSLPAGLSIASGTGVISGTPTTAEAPNFTVKATDDQGTPDTDTQALSITIGSGGGSTYEIGPGKTYTNINDFPWEDITAGDTVKIYYKVTPYYEKFGVFGQGTASDPITIQGVPGGGGELPLIDGDGATTRSSDDVDFWSENRQVLKIGGSTVPQCDADNNPPDYVVIENLEIRNGNDAYTFTNGDGTPNVSYNSNASSIRAECGSNITIRNCILYGSGNNILTSGATAELLIEGCYIYDGGDGVAEHNIYTEGRGIIVQYNHIGPTIPAGGVGFKDRSAGTICRYNWIEGGVRQVNLVESYDYQIIRDDPRYGVGDMIYGNILYDQDTHDVTDEMILYGGDMGGENEQYYRSGPVQVFNNTMVSTRSGGTRMIRLKTDDQSANLYNNIFYCSQGGSTKIILSSNLGTCTASYNWFNTGVSTTGVTMDDPDTNIYGTAPGFTNFGNEDFTLTGDSDCVDAGGDLLALVMPEFEPIYEYLKHQDYQSRPSDGSLDIGAYEYGSTSSLAVDTTSLPDGTVSTAYSSYVHAYGGVKPYTWSVYSGSLPAGTSLDTATGAITGTPTTGGTSNFTVQVEDSAGTPATDTQALSIYVAGAPANLVITTSSLPDGTVDVAYSETVVATGGTTPYTWTIDSGSLPAGLSLASGTGVISGTPTTDETANFTVKVTDDQGTPATDTQALSITINAAPSGPTITTTSLPDGSRGDPYSETVVATGGTTPYTWTVVSGSLGNGLSLNSSTGVISGTPRGSAGTRNFTIRCTGDNSLYDEQALSITVNN